MNKPVDTELTSKIRQVFDDFEDPGAEAGWLELRKKYPNRKRRPLFFWMGSVAASLLVAAGLWLFNQETNTGSKTVLRKPVKTETVIAQDKKEPITNSDLGSQPFAKIKSPSKSQETENSVYVKEIEKQPLKFSKQADFSAQIIEPTASAIQPNLPVEKVPAKTLGEEISNKPPIAITQPEASIAKVLPAEKPAVRENLNILPKATRKEPFKTSSKAQKLAFSVFAGTYFNYSEGSENQLNFGAGFVSDIRLSKNLKLSTGLSIASNSLSYSNNLPESAISSLDAALSSPLSSGGSGISSIYPTITSYNAELLALDIPVNIKYQFVPESDKFYVSAGLSSGTYLAETYGYQYRNFNPSTGFYSGQSQDEKIKKQLNDFDLGRTLNLSMGLSTKFGKMQTISIEPFLKYPLGGLGSQNLKFGSTGINLKLHFKSVKK
jgi:hypothetical protein